MELTHGPYSEYSWEKQNYKQIRKMKIVQIMCVKWFRFL